MRTMTQTDLNRHKKRKGVKVRRKFGSENEKPEPEVNGKPLSGDLSKAGVVPVPAFEFYSIMEKMTNVIDKLTNHEASESKEHEGEIEAKLEQVAQVAPEEREKRPFEVLREMQDAGELPPPTAASAPEVEAPEVPKPSGNWDHVYRRDRSGLVMQIVSIDKAGNQWTHDFARAGTKFIIEILSKSNTGLRFMHKFYRNDPSGLIENATTRVEA